MSEVLYWQAFLHNSVWLLDVSCQVLDIYLYCCGELLPKNIASDGNSLDRVRLTGMFTECVTLQCAHEATHALGKAHCPESHSRHTFSVLLGLSV